MSSMASACERCGGPLDLLKPGRVPRFCSSPCRQAAYRDRQPKVPTELLRQDRWVVWKPICRKGRLTKMPLQVDGSWASSTDPATWTSYTKVRHLDRKGFVLGGGIGCIDLDHCLIDGVPTRAAVEFLAGLPSTYVEVSPGGDGLHVWGLLPEGPGTVRTVDGLSIETYSVGRYITFTGKAFTGSVPHLGVLTG